MLLKITRIVVIVWLTAANIPFLPKFSSYFIFTSTSLYLYLYLIFIGFLIFIVLLGLGITRYIRIKLKKENTKEIKRIIIWVIVGIVGGIIIFIIPFRNMGENEAKRLYCPSPWLKESKQKCLTIPVDMPSSKINKNRDK